MLKTQTTSSNGETGYNGWANHETWCVHLWLNNDEITYNVIRELIQKTSDSYKASQAVKDHIEEASPLNDQASLYSDLLNAALQSVNWLEIVAAFKEDEEV